MVALIASVSIMVIIVTTVTISAVTVSNNAKKVKFGTEIAYVQELTYNYQMNHNGNYPVKNSITLDLAAVTAKALPQFDQESKINNKITLYEIDFNLLGKSELKYGHQLNGDRLDLYAVSKETGLVYYLKGIKVGGNTYYALTDDLKQLINYVDIENEIAKDGIIFIPSTTEWTNQSVNMEIRVPSSYTNVTVSFNRNNVATTNVSQVSTSGSYFVYRIENVADQYTVKVAYTKDTQAKNVEYSVTNYNNTVPSFTLSQKEELAENQNYIKVENLNVGLSGINKIKYEKELIEGDYIKQYFLNYGQTVENNVINIDDSTEYVTVYVEDNAGNYAHKNLEVAKYSYLSYSRNGLVLQLDGKMNTRNGKDEASNVWEDLSGNQNDGTLEQYAQEDSKWWGNRLSFNGKTNRVVIPLSSNLKVADQTIEILLVKDSVVNNDRSIFFVTWPGFTMEFNNDNSVTYGRANGYLKATNKVVLNRYYSIVATFSNGIQKIYLNNEFNGSQAKIASGYGSSPITIGSYGKILYFDGEIYSIRMYNRELTEEERTNHYNIDKIRFNLR